MIQFNDTIQLASMMNRFNDSIIIQFNDSIQFASAAAILNEMYIAVHTALGHKVPAAATLASPVPE